MRQLANFALPVVAVMFLWTVPATAAMHPPAIGLLIPMSSEAASRLATPQAAETVPAVRRFARSLTYETVSREDRAAMDYSGFFDFHRFLKEAYPGVHTVLQRDVVNGYSLLYTWRGKRSDLGAVLLAAHMDVVPAGGGTLELWEHPPFAGVVDDGKVWGRGAFDNKGGVIAILEAVEHLLEEGFDPERTVYLAFGHDEELGGQDGALEISRLLESRGAVVEAVVDEGGLVVHPDLFEGLDSAMGLIGIAEKGEVNLRLVVENPGQGSHSSMPPPTTPVGILSAGIARLEATPFRARLGRPVDEFLDNLAQAEPTLERLVLTNRWLFGPIIRRRLEKNLLTNAMIRTTMTPTMIRGSEKPNSIAATAEAVVNLRILPGDTVESVTRGVREKLADRRIQIDVMPGTVPRDPSPVSSTGTHFYRHLHSRIRADYPEIGVLTPFLTPGGTDSRHYLSLTHNILRFFPISLDAENSKGPHGVNEWVWVDDYLRAVRFYADLIRTYDTDS